MTVAEMQAPGRPRIVVTGASGQLGWELVRSLAPLGEVIGMDLPEIDLCHTDSIRTALRPSRPSVVVNTAAFTAVDDAERQPDLVASVNARAPGIFAEECRRLGAFLIHYSTDYVFDGEKVEAYTENDRPNPLGVYGRSKLEGEQAIRDLECPHLILRTSWLYSARGHNFLLTMLRLARERQIIRIVNDQLGAPTWARSLSDLTAHMVDRVLRASPLEREQFSGTYHATARGVTSWYAFARAIFDRAAARGLSRAPALEPISSESYASLARRPRNSSLDNGKLHATFGLALPPWEQALTQCIDDLVSERVAVLRPDTSFLLPDAQC